VARYRLPASSGQGDRRQRPRPEARPPRRRRERPSGRVETVEKVVTGHLLRPDRRGMASVLECANFVGIPRRRSEHTPGTGRLWRSLHPDSPWSPLLAVALPYSPAARRPGRQTPSDPSLVRHRQAVPERRLPGPSVPGSPGLCADCRARRYRVVVSGGLATRLSMRTNGSLVDGERRRRYGACRGRLRTSDVVSVAA
jgi:hypothetical protein